MWVHVNSDRNPERKPAGYKDLEIALRAQERKLQGVSRSLSFDQREPVEAALKVASSVRDEMSHRLFPQNPRSR